MTDQAERERQSLQRIIATLFSLACHAYRASTQSDARRRLVLWILRPAAAGACDAVMGLDIDRRNYPLADFMSDQNSPEDALHLAQTFCVLAVLHHYVLVRSLPKRGSQHPALDASFAINAIVELTAQPSRGGGGCVRDAGTGGPCCNTMARLVTYNHQK